MSKEVSTQRIGWTSTIHRFALELRAELRRISWGSAKELQATVRMIAISIFAFGMATYIVDLAIQFALQTARAVLLRVLM